MLNRAFCQKVRLQYLFDRTNYCVAADGTVAVTVFLREIFDPAVSSSLLAIGEDGLISGGVLIQGDQPTPTRPARVRTTSSITGNPSFDFAIIPQLPVPTYANSVGLVELSADPVFGQERSRTARIATVLLALGTFTFTAGPLARGGRQLAAVPTA